LTTKDLFIRGYGHDLKTTGVTFTALIPPKAKFVKTKSYNDANAAASFEIDAEATAVA